MLVAAETMWNEEITSIQVLLYTDTIAVTTCLLHPTLPITAYTKFPCIVERWFLQVITFPLCGACAWLCLLQLETFEAVNNSLIGTLPVSWSNLGDHRVSAAAVACNPTNSQQTIRYQKQAACLAKGLCRLCCQVHT